MTVLDNREYAAKKPSIGKLQLFLGIGRKALNFVLASIFACLGTCVS